jgi:hypothetical protein
MSNFTDDILLFTDDLLLNIFVNLTKYPKMFYNKDRIVEFSNKVKAEHFLGLKSKARPKHLRAIISHNPKKDFEEDGLPGSNGNDIMGLLRLSNPNTVDR